MGSKAVILLVVGEPAQTRPDRLWRGRRWAEYLTTLATASLIPLELWALFAEPTVLRGVAVLVNAGILVVLVVVLRRQHRRRVGAAG